MTPAGPRGRVPQHCSHAPGSRRGDGGGLTKERALSQLMLGEEPGCTERNIRNARAGSQRQFWNLTRDPVTGESEQDNPLMGSKGCPDQGSKQGHEERQPGQGRNAKPRLRTRPGESYCPELGAGEGRTAPLSTRAPFSLTRSVSPEQAGSVWRWPEDVTLYPGEGRGLGFCKF